MMPLPRKIALAVIVASVAGVAVWSLRTKPRAVHPIDAVPADAFVAIEVNIDVLRKSGALAAVFGDRDEQSLTQVCGFDPVDKMTDLVFAIPEGGTGEFGVAVQSDLTQGELTRCADAVVTGHGGDPTSDIVARGSYSIITPRRTSTDSTKPPRSLGYRSGAPILVGPKRWISSMIDAVDDVGDGTGSPGQHVTLRTSLGDGISPPPAFVLTATTLLDRAVRDKLKAEMLAQVGPGDDPGTAMMIGVLGMTSGVLGLYEQGGEVHALVKLHCEEEAQCSQVDKLIAKVGGQWAATPELRAFGLGPVLDHLEVDHHGRELRVRTSAATGDVVRWAKLFLDAKGLGLAGKTSTVPLSSDADVPTQTVKIQVPEGVKQGQPFTVNFTRPASTSDPQGTRPLIATVVPNVPAASSSSASQSPPLHPPP